MQRQKSTPKSGVPTVGRTEFHSVLEHVCTYSAPVVVLTTSTARSLRGRFPSLTSNGVHIDLDAADLDPEELGMLTACVVTFGRGGATYVFLSNVTREPGTPGRPAGRLTLARPRHIVRGEARSTSRVPVARRASLEVTLLQGEGRSVSLQPVDISLTGMLVSFKGTNAKMAVGETGWIRLRLRDTEVTVSAQARAVNGHRVGLFFPDSLRGDDLAPPEPLRDLIRQLKAIRR